MKTLIVGALGFYQKWLSPLSAPKCKYYPSCSSYAISAISAHGTKGLLMAFWRLLRCNPWSHGGVDYVRTDERKKLDFKALTKTITSKGVTL